MTGRALISFLYLTSSIRIISKELVFAGAALLTICRRKWECAACLLRNMTAYIIR
jgi:hypothetical protein